MFSENPTRTVAARERSDTLLLVKKPMENIVLSDKQRVELEAKKNAEILERKARVTAGRQAMSCAEPL